MMTTRWRLELIEDSHVASKISQIDTNLPFFSFLEMEIAFNLRLVSISLICNQPFFGLSQGCFKWISLFNMLLSYTFICHSWIMSMTINDILLLHLHLMIMSSFNDNIHDSHHGHEQGPGGWCVGRNARDEKARREHHVFASHCQVQHFIWNKWNLVQHFIYKILVGNTMFLPLIVRYNILSEINKIQIEEKLKKKIYSFFVCWCEPKMFWFFSLSLFCEPLPMYNLCQEHHIFA